jgi:hypothetical protein
VDGEPIVAARSHAVNEIAVLPLVCRPVELRGENGPSRACFSVREDIDAMVKAR